MFRRQALDRGAASLGVDHIVTGHNADDMAETVLMNVLRGDIARLERCTEIVTKGPEGHDDDEQAQGCGGGASSFGGSGIKRSKPFKYAYEKEIVMYAYFKQLDYFSTECIYSPNAYRGYARSFLKDLESIRPTSIIDIIHSGENLRVADTVKRAVQRTYSTATRILTWQGHARDVATFRRTSCAKHACSWRRSTAARPR